jgi:hypothetical protein
MKNILNSKIFYFLIFFCFLSSIFLAKNNLSKYDKNIIGSDGEIQHVMIKNDTRRYFSHGHEIKEQIKNGENFFKTGQPNFTKYLFPRIAAAYYLIFDIDLYSEDKEKNKIINVGVHAKYLFLQIFLYYSCLVFFYIQLKNIFERNILFITILFLGIEPTLFQYHSSFWSESLFFSILIILFGLVINNTQSKKRYFFVGLFLGLLAIQRSNGFFYIIPVIIYFYITNRFNFYKKIFFTLLGYSLVLLFVGYNNFARSNSFSIVPSEMKAVLHAYVLPNVLSKKVFEQEKKLTISLINKEKIILDQKFLDELEYSRYSFIFCDVKKEDPRYLNICNYLEKRSYKLIFLNIDDTFLYWIKKSFHFVLLNPFHIYSDNQFLSAKVYYGSDLHQKLVPYRIIYSSIIYIVCLIGFFKILKLKDKKIFYFSLASILYFFLILSWHGNTRYFTPILIYLSFFFSFGAIKIYEFAKQKINLKN